MSSRPATDRYWDAIADHTDGLPVGWRHQARREHLALIDEWVGRPLGRWLKTDLFEEQSPHRALLPSLDTAASWVGLDVSGEVAARARRRLGTAAVVADVRHLSFPRHSFDGVLSTSTLDHFEEAADIGRAVSELHRVLRPGGRLVLTLDNPANPLIRLRNLLPPAVARRSGLVPFSVGRTLADRPARHLLEACGFRVDATAHLLHAPHVVGTRLARFGWYTDHVLPRFAALASTRLGPYTGHYVALLATAS